MLSAARLGREWEPLAVQIWLVGSARCTSGRYLPLTTTYRSSG